MLVQYIVYTYMSIFLEPFPNTSQRDQPSVKELTQNPFFPCNNNIVKKVLYNYIK